MIQIQDTLVSLDVIGKKFFCNLQRCKGICCVHGDSGAPLEEAEAGALKRYYASFEPYMSDAGREAVLQQGTAVIDSDGDLVTPLIEGRECAYARQEKGIYKCAVETAWQKGAIPFRKPISCHLFPVRIRKFRDFTAVNYEFWHDCKPALEHGNETGIYLYRFLKEALVRKFGKKWYRELADNAAVYHKQFQNKQ